MSRLLTFTLACLLGAAASPAQASILGGYLTFDGPVHRTSPPSRGGGEDLLKSNALSVLVDQGAPGFDKDDVVWGMLKLNSIGVSSLTPKNVSLTNQIVVVFSARIDAPTPSGAINLVPVGDATNPYDLRKLLDPSVQNGLSDQTLATVLSSGPPQAPDDDPWNWSPTQISDPATGFSVANGWSWELTADLQPGTDDFYHFLPTGLTSGIDATALTITSSSFPTTWLPVDVADFAGGVHLGDLTLDRGFVGLAAPAQLARGWTFTDDSSLFVNAVPEPTSLAVLGVLGAAALLRRGRISASREGSKSLARNRD